MELEDVQYFGNHSSYTKITAFPKHSPESKRESASFKNMNVVKYI